MADTDSDTNQLRAEISAAWKQLAAESEAKEPESIGDSDARLLQTVRLELDACREELAALRVEENMIPAAFTNLEQEIKRLEEAQLRIQSFIDWKHGFINAQVEGTSEVPSASMGTENDGLVPFHESIVRVGHVAVESTQLLIADPWIVHAFWKHEPVNNAQRFRDVYTQRVYEHRVDFHNPVDVIADVGMSVVEAVECGRLEKVEEIAPPFYTLSYNQISKANAAVEGGIGSELAFDDGAPGAGVSIPLADDGTFPVFAEIHDGRVSRIIIDF